MQGYKVTTMNIADTKRPQRSRVKEADIEKKLNPGLEVLSTRLQEVS